MEFKIALMVVVYGLIMLAIGLFIGWKNGKIRGMEEFVSLLKVYDTDGSLVQKISSLFGKVDKMSEVEKEKLFKDYLEKNYGIIVKEDEN